MSSQDGYDWPNGCQDEQWPTGAEPTEAQRKLARHFNESPSYSVEGALAAAAKRESSERIYRLAKALWQVR